MFDFLNAAALLNSLHESQNAAATLTGTYKDCQTIDGPVYANVGVGEVAGAPDSQSAVFTLMEADDASGTNAQAIAVQSTAVTLTADKGRGRLRGIRTKPFVAVKCVLSFVNGTSPKQDVFGDLTGCLSRVGSA